MPYPVKLSEKDISRLLPDLVEHICSRFEDGGLENSEALWLEVDEFVWTEVSPVLENLRVRVS
jgi:hypothetical protein